MELLCLILQLLGSVLLPLVSFNQAGDGSLQFGDFLDRRREIDIANERAVFAGRGLVERAGLQDVTFVSKLCGAVP